MALIKCRHIFILICFLMLSSCNAGPASNNQAKTTVPAVPKYQVYTVEIKNMKFVPDSLVVKKGDEIVFVNRDIVDHCVTEEKNNSWTSGKLHSDGSYLLVAKESTIYYCAIHQVMKGKIIVQ